MGKTILVDINDGYYILSGEINFILNNRRLLAMFKGLFNVDIQDDRILILFEEKLSTAVYFRIQQFLSRFGFDVELSSKVKEKESSVLREQENFKIFSEKAKKIRNNDFSDRAELLDDFKEFKKVLSKNLKRILYPLQMLSAFHMAFAQNSCNFAVPGAGKTSIVYGAYAYLKSLPIDDPRHVDKLLVIGPLSSFAPWENEYKDCFGRDVNSQRLSGDNKILKNHKEQHLYSSNPKELTLIFHGGVDSLEKEITDFLKQNKTMVVVDEAHRIKNPNGIWGQSVVEIAKEAIARIILTGTPIPNGYEDLYNLYRFIYPFKFQDILQIHYNQLIELTKNSVSTENERVKNFIDNISPYFIRIKKKDLELPPINEKLVPVEMDDGQVEIYNFIEEKYIPELQKKPAGTAIDLLNKARLIRLRQVSQTLRFY